MKQIEQPITVLKLIETPIGKIHNFFLYFFSLRQRLFLLSALSIWGIVKEDPRQLNTGGPSFLCLKRANANCT